MIHQYHPDKNKALKTIIWDYGIGSQEREKEKQKGYRGNIHLLTYSMYKDKRYRSVCAKMKITDNKKRVTGAKRGKRV